MMKFQQGLLAVSVAAFFLVVGCGGQKASPAAEKPSATAKTSTERPKPGTMISSPPTPVDLKSRWVWKDLWLDVKDLGTFRLECFGSRDSEDGKAKEYTAGDVDNCFVLGIEAGALDAEKCIGLQVELPNSKQAGIWWARESDIQPDTYPFQRDRFEPMREAGPGVFEVDLTAGRSKANWNGAIRMIRIDPYANSGDTVVLRKVRGNLARGSSVTDAPKIDLAVKPDAASRAAALFERASLTGVVADIGAAASALSRAASAVNDGDRNALADRGKQQGLQLLDAGDAKAALRAFSAAGVVSSSPVEFLRDLAGGLNDAQRKSLWPKEPFLTVESFENTVGGPLFVWADKNNRPILKNEVVQTGALDGEACAHLAVGRANGAAWYAAPVAIPVAEPPFSLRFWMRESSPSSVAGIVLAQLPQAKQYAYLSANLDFVDDGTGWKCGDLAIDIHQRLVDTEQKQKGVDIANAVISVVGLKVEGGANEFWLDRIEVYLLDKSAAPPATP